MKQQTDKNIVVYGSASIVQALTKLGLVDQYQLLVHPLILGSGKPLFAHSEERVKLKLLSAQTDPSGAGAAVLPRLTRGTA